MAAKRTMWSKIGKYVSAVVIACFFLPFFGVSCDGMDVVTISGADMVGGCKPGGLIAAAADEDTKVSGGSIDAKIENVSVEPLAIAALALVVLVFGLSLVGSRQALLGTMVAAVLACGALVGLYITIKAEIGEQVEKQSESMARGQMTKDVKVSAGGRFGLWLVSIGLLSTIGMTASALRRRQEIDPVLPAAPPA